MPELMTKAEVCALLHVHHRIPQTTGEQPTREEIMSEQIASPYLTAAEAAIYLRTTIQGVYSLVKRGRIHPMPGSGKLLFTREALDRYLSNRRR